MNNKLPRLVLVGLGSVAVAVLSVFSAKNLSGSVKSAGASVDGSSFEIAGATCCTIERCRPCNPPTAVTAVRG